MSKTKLLKVSLIFILLCKIICVLPNLPTQMSAYDSIWVDDLKTVADPYCPLTNCANEKYRYIKYIKRMGTTSWADVFQGYNFEGDNTVISNLITILVMLAS